MKKITLTIIGLMSAVLFLVPNTSLASVQPSYTYPMINFIISAGVSSSTEIIFWNSNKETKSTLWWGTAPLTLKSATKYSDNLSDTNHFLNLNGLTPGITYYYVVTVSDSKYSATSTMQSFTI